MWNNDRKHPTKVQIIKIIKMIGLFKIYKLSCIIRTLNPIARTNKLGL